MDFRGAARSSRTVPEVRGAARAFLLCAAALTAAGCGSAASLPELRIGAMFPLQGTGSALAGDELRGATIAAGMVNADGGVGGHHIVLDVRNVQSGAQVQSAAASLAQDGVPAIIGAYASALSIPAAAAVAARGIVYWETGAVADQLTGRGLPLVFRVGADGADLGANSARFAMTQLAPRLHANNVSLRVFLVTADDAYAHSVADAARRALTAAGVRRVGESVYNPNAPAWAPVLDAIARAHPTVLILSSHIPDGIAFRRAFLAAHLHVDAFIGSTMAQCLPNFGDELGADAVGVFASDRPDDDFNPAALDSGARAVYERFSAVWQLQTGRAVDEEAIAGFSAAWALFHNVLPRAASLTAPAIAAAARTLDLPEGSLPNGAGVRFSTAAGTLGQNTRAAAVIEQWQAVRTERAVWPPTYATSSIQLVPLPA